MRTRSITGRYAQTVHLIAHAEEVWLFIHEATKRKDEFGKELRIAPLVELGE